MHDRDVHGCMADVGWITGHSYIVYGPLSNGVTTVMFEGMPTYPNASRYWEIVDKLKLTQFYTAPTAIRALRRLGDEFVNNYKLDSLRVLGYCHYLKVNFAYRSVGEVVLTLMLANQP